MKKLAMLAAGLMLCLLSVSGQRTCGTMDALEEQLERDPDLKEQMDLIERHTRSVLRNRQRTTGEVIVIPVVVHVVWNQPEENLSEAQIFSQIDVLNEDFRRMNADTNDIWPQAADTQFEFCLATTDPNGLPTCGITRTETSETSFSQSGNPVKFTANGGIDAWPRNAYLNIWVCDLAGFLGYAQFPGGAAATDGVVVDYYSFGRVGVLDPNYDLGRTTTHEVGHWLNLRHIWGDGPCPADDMVDDTPKARAANYGCAVGASSCGSEDMVQNYMDYSDDYCMNLYTMGQAYRMRALFDTSGFRESLLTSPGCNAGPGCPPLTLTIVLDNYPEEVSWDVVDSLTNVVVASGGPYNGLGGQTTVENICIENGAYAFNMYDSFSDGICCAEGEGEFYLTLGTDTIHYSNGDYGEGESFGFTVDFDPAYVFQGPGADWFDPLNWNTGRVPPECFYGVIVIVHDCIASGAAPFYENVEVIVQSGVTLNWN